MNLKSESIISESVIMLGALVEAEGVPERKGVADSVAVSRVELSRPINSHHKIRVRSLETPECSRGITPGRRRMD